MNFEEDTCQSAKTAKAQDPRHAGLTEVVSAVSRVVLLLGVGNAENDTRDNRDLFGSKSETCLAINLGVAYDELRSYDGQIVDAEDGTSRDAAPTILISKYIVVIHGPMAQKWGPLAIREEAGMEVGRCRRNARV